jgi:hypothetical protein
MLLKAVGQPLSTAKRV